MVFNRISHKSHLRLTIITHINGYQIETRFQVTTTLRHIGGRAMHQSTTLGRSHRLFGRSETSCTARFDLHKVQFIVTTRYNINLVTTAPPVQITKFEALAAQILRRELLASMSRLSGRRHSKNDKSSPALTSYGVIPLRKIRIGRAPINSNRLPW